MGEGFFWITGGGRGTVHHAEAAWYQLAHIRAVRKQRKEKPSVHLAFSLLFCPGAQLWDAAPHAWGGSSPFSW